MVFFKKKLHLLAPQWKLNVEIECSKKVRILLESNHSTTQTFLIRNFEEHLFTWRCGRWGCPLCRSSSCSRGTSWGRTRRRRRGRCCRRRRRRRPRRPRRSVWKKKMNRVEVGIRKDKQLLNFSCSNRSYLPQAPSFLSWCSSLQYKYVLNWIPSLTFGFGQDIPFNARPVCPDVILRESGAFWSLLAHWFFLISRNAQETKKLAHFDFFITLRSKADMIKILKNILKKSKSKLLLKRLKIK